MTYGVRGGCACSGPARPGSGVGASRDVHRETSRVHAGLGLVSRSGGDHFVRAGVRADCPSGRRGSGGSREALRGTEASNIVVGYLATPTPILAWHSGHPMPCPVPDVGGRPSGGPDPRRGGNCGSRMAPKRSTGSLGSPLPSGLREPSRAHCRSRSSPPPAAAPRPPQGPAAPPPQLTLRGPVPAGTG